MSLVAPFACMRDNAGLREPCSSGKKCAIRHANSRRIIKSGSQKKQRVKKNAKLYTLQYVYMYLM